VRLTVLRVPARDAELAADRLWSAGGRAVEELGGADGVVELRTVLAADDTTSRGRLGPLPDDWMLAFVDADEPPSEAWRDHAEPIAVNDELVLLPAWLSSEHVRDVSDTSRTVEIEPAGSFGLGDHPTTRLSADAVWRLVSRGDRVLDVGCGSGVLSIIAVLRGAREVVAVDIAEAAREATVANAERNGVADVIDAATTPVHEIDGQFDVVLANMLAPTLIALSADLRRLTAPSGRLVISGILADRHDHVLEAVRPMVVVSTHVFEGWAAVELCWP